MFHDHGFCFDAIFWMMLALYSENFMGNLPTRKFARVIPVVMPKHNPPCSYEPTLKWALGHVIGEIRLESSSR